MALTPGTPLGPYEVLSLLGAGGMGEVYHFGCGPGPDVPLSLLDAVTGRDRLLGQVERPDEGLTVSPDGKTLLYTRRVREGSDLMMIENFW